MPDFDVVLKDKHDEERSVLIKAKTKDEAHRITKTLNSDERVVSHLTKNF